MATASADGGKPGTAGYYNELANYAVRFTFSGDYYHSAPWSVIAQAPPTFCTAA